MKIKTIKLPYLEVLKRKPKKLKKPVRTLMFWKILIKIISIFDLWAVKFKCNKINIDKLNKKEPCLILMNHSSFLDMEIAYSVLWNKTFNIVTTTDAFVGKNWLLRQIGCMPTVKFLNDPLLVRNMISVLKQKRSILLFPEAGYTLDGTATTMPYALAKLVKFLKVPLATIITNGAHLRQPLFNKLRKRKVRVTCDYKYVLSKEDIKNMSVDEIWEIIQKEFSFNNYEYQIENNIIIKEKDRAENLNSILYKCPHCKTEGMMKGYNNLLECEHCNIKYELKENGELQCINGETLFNTIPKWYKYQREEVKKEVENNQYLLDTDVDVIIMKDTYSLYEVGSGHLIHNIEGFNLKLDDGSLDYNYSSKTSYSINSDIYWYQIGDVVCIGDYNIQYYCIPKKKDVVVKARLATEEIFKKIQN
jgi:1-acyl-sn-glycerol-3-phosphate acyltransferase